MQGWFNIQKSIIIIHHVSGLKQNQMIITRDSGKAFYKHIAMILKKLSEEKD